MGDAVFVWPAQHDETPSWLKHLLLYVQEKFHRGEIAVQERAGARREGSLNGDGIRSFVPLQLGRFLGTQSLAVIAGVDARGNMWASLLAGAAGFIELQDEHHVRFAALPAEGDPLRIRLTSAIAIASGVIVIDVESRRRIRLNGMAQIRDGGIDLLVRECFGNCPQYIQLRQPISNGRDGLHPTAKSGTELTPEQQQWIARADTFFIATSNPETGADASHRGGQPGFVRVLSPRKLAWPDYSGNNMFQTLGNLALNPSAGLLFVDFATGSTLQLSGQATIIWDRAAFADFPGALRMVEFNIAESVEITNATAARYVLREYSPFNPRG